MKNKLLSLLLATLMAFAPCIIASAYTRPGPGVWDMEQKYLAESSNVKSSGKMLIVSDGGYVLYDYFAEIDTERIEIHYSDAKNAKVTISPEGSESQSFVLDPDGNMVTYTFATTQRRGDNRLRLDFEGSVNISAIRFHAKHLTQYTFSGQMTAELSDKEDIIATAVAMKLDSPVILVNGSRRYVDEENINTKPINIDGSIYLPIKTLAYALGYYYESMPEKNFCMLRLEKESFVYRDGKMICQNGHDAGTPVDVVPKLIDGTYWLPVRYFAEVIDETVMFKNGIAVVDSRTYANNIINDEEALSYINSKLTGFTKEKLAGNVYYVAQSFNANDKNPGTIDAPFRTLKKAGEVAQAGDTVIIREGTYREILAPMNDGTESSPIVFRAADGEKVTISALEEFDNFVDNGKGIAMAKLPWDLGIGRNQVFYNGECIVEARYPNNPGIAMADNVEPLSDLFPVKGDFLVPDDNADIVVSDTLLNQEANHWKGATYISMHGYGWTLSSAIVESSEPGKLNLTGKSKRWWYSPDTGNHADWGYLSGHVNCMDLPGEWVIQDGILLILPPEGETAESLTVEIKKRQQTIDLTDRKYIRIEGINTIGGSANLNNTEMCTLNRMNMCYISHFTWCDDWREGFIEDYSAEALREGKSTVLTGEVGIHMGGKDNRIINSVIDHSAGAGIISTGLYGYLENNIIKNCGYMGSYVSGITLMQPGSQTPDSLCGGEAVFNNTVYNCGRSCFVVLAAEGAGWTGYTTYSRFPRLPYEVAYNDFHDGILFSLDTGITYEYQVNTCTERLMSRMHNNYIYYTLPETCPFSFGLYHDGNTSGIDTWENVVFATKSDVTFTSAYLFSNKTLSPNAMWNNKELKFMDLPNAAKDLKAEHFPYGMPFYAGSKLDAEDFLLNYEDAQTNVMFYKASQGQLGKGATVDKNGAALLTSRDQYVEIKDVDFGENGINAVDIYYSGDRYRRSSAIMFGVGESLDTVDWDAFEITFSADKMHQLNVTTRNYGKITGKSNVYIKLNSSVPVSIDGLIFTLNENFVAETHDGSKVLGGEFNRIDKKGGAEPQAVYTDPAEPHVKDVWGGTVLRYKNVVIPENAKVLYVNTGVATPYDGQDIIFSYSEAGDPSNTYIGTVTTTNNGWNTRTDSQYVELDKAIPAGAVDIYVTFTNGATETKKSCNLYSFGFLTEKPE